MGNKNNAKFSENTEINETVTEPETIPVVEENKEEEVVTTTPEEITEPETTPVVEENITTEVETEPETEVETEPETTPEEVVNKADSVVGTIVKCVRLNVRKEPNKDAKVVGVLNKDDSVDINIEESTNDFYKVSTMTVTGYCVKDFIEIR